MKTTHTPYFLIHKRTLDENIQSFSSAMSLCWNNSQLCYSVKTNSLPWLLSYLNKKNIFAEVVSDEEYALALSCNVPDSHIVFNGPIKGEAFFKRALINKATVNLDSKNDVNCLVKHASIVDIEKIGIRVNVPSSIFDSTDIGYIEDGFRFGFSYETGEFQNVLQTIRRIWGNKRLGLHLHVNSITRSLNVYRAIARYAAQLIDECKMNVSFIDIGGGFFGGVEGKPTPQEYIRAIRQELDGTINCEDVKLYAEPGSAIIGSSADLVTSVIDIKETSSSIIVTTDGSRIHIDPLWGKTKYRYTILSNSPTTHRSTPKKEQIICGYTCMDHDRIMTLKTEKSLLPGDRIVYQRVGAYTMTFGGAFIRYLPEVFLESNNNLTCIRNSMSVDDYISLNSKNK